MGVWREFARLTVVELPRELLEEATLHLEERLIACGSNHQGRRTQIWLGRWQQLVQHGLSRKGSDS